jgi:molybdenum cofactor cytidylyltransferase
MSIPPPPPTLPAILLAAGLSSRMGAFKPLLPLAGTPLIQRVIDSLRHSGAIGDILVVTGHRTAEVEAALAGAGVSTVFNPDYERGEMLSSLRAGIAELSRRNVRPPGFVLAFADQPAVLSSTVHTLVRGFNAENPPVAIPEYAGKRGHPIILSMALANEIAALAPHETLRTVVHRHLAQAALIKVDDRSVLDDLDTPADFARAQAACSASPPDITKP